MLYKYFAELMYSTTMHFCLQAIKSKGEEHEELLADLQTRRDSLQDQLSEADHAQLKDRLAAIKESLSR